MGINDCDFGILPKPLSPQKIEYYFRLYKNGDLNARETLIKSNIRLVRAIASRYASHNYHIDDLIEVGCIGLVKAIDTFDINKNIKLSTYAGRCIANEIMMFLRNNNKHINNVSLEDVISTDKDGNNQNIKDTLSDANTDIIRDYENKEQILILRNLLDDLPERDRKIIKLYFGFYDDKRYKQSELASMYNINQAQISRIIKKNIAILKEQLNNYSLPKYQIEKPITKNIHNNKLETKQSTLNQDDKNNMMNAVKEKEGEITMKKTKTIYEYFNTYSEEEVNTMLSKLSDKDIRLIKLKYGDDLKNPVTSSEFTSKQSASFFSALVPKMRKILDNPNYKQKIRQNNQSTAEKYNISPVDMDNGGPQPNETNITDSNSTKNSSKSMEKLVTSEEYIKTLEFFNNPLFEQVLTNFDFKERVIITLVLGQLDKETPKYYSTEAIAQFLDMNIEEVREIITNGLLAYKDIISRHIDATIDTITHQKSIGVKK